MTIAAHDYSYDAIGNITNFAGESYAYTGAQPHAVTAAFSNTYAYDDNGNQTTRIITSTTYTVTYDYENRLTGVYEGIAIVGEFVYDVDGQRVVGTVDGETVVYIAGLYEYHEGGATISYYDGNAGSVAMRRVGHAEENGIFYIVGDHLGSASVIVNQDGTPSSFQYYYPFGGNRGGLLSPLTTKRYTGQYHEEGLPGGEGLSYYGARWYDAQVGRFTSADMLIPVPQNPIDLNRYAYVRNNPLKNTDPTGHVVESLTEPLEAEPLGYSPPTITISVDKSQAPNSGEYLVTENYGTFDKDHYGTGSPIELIRAIEARAEKGGIFKIDAALGGGWFAFEGAYYVSKTLPSNLRIAAAYDIYTDWSKRFETWQGTFPLNRLKETRLC